MPDTKKNPIPQLPDHIRLVQLFSDLVVPPEQIPALLEQLRDKAADLMFECQTPEFPPHWAAHHQLLKHLEEEWGWTALPVKKGDLYAHRSPGMSYSLAQFRFARTWMPSLMKQLEAEWKWANPPVTEGETYPYLSASQFGLAQFHFLGTWMPRYHLQVLMEALAPHLYYPSDRQIAFIFLDAETQTSYRYLFEPGVAGHPETAQVRLEYQVQRWVPYAAFPAPENRAEVQRIEATPVRLHYFPSYQPFSKHALKWRVVRNWNGVYRVITRFESKEACEQFIRLLPVSHEEHDVEEARASVAGTLALIAEANEWLTRSIPMKSSSKAPRPRNVVAVARPFFFPLLCSNFPSHFEKHMS